MAIFELEQSDGDLSPVAGLALVFAYLQHYPRI
jgi:hypothetical protein